MGDDLYKPEKPKRGDGSQRTGCMGLLMTLSVGITVTATVILFAFPFATVLSEDFARWISPLFCEADRTLIVRAGSSFAGQSSSFSFNDVPTYFYCANHDGVFLLEDDITHRFTFVMVGLACLIPIMILLVIGQGAASPTRKSTTTPVPERYSKMVDLSPMKPKNEPYVDDISERMRELKELYDQGLITTEEYNRKREEILQDL
jgi:hypothetical protein